MSLPGYDEWKLRTPEEEYEAHGGKICPFCGAYSPRSCELEEETDGNCPWEMSEPDPDELMEQRRDDQQWERDHPQARDGWDDWDD